MSVRTQEIERGLGNLRARQFHVIHGINRDHVDAQQVAELQRPSARRRLPDHDQVELGVVEFLEQILDRAVRAELEPQPREAIARARRAIRQTLQGLRQGGFPVADADLGDVRNANFCIRSRLIANAAILARTFVRSKPASQLSETTSMNARSVVLSNRRATGTRSSSYESSNAASARPLTTSASFHARLYASCKPVFMPCAPTGL